VSTPFKSPAVELRGITKSFKGAVANENINLKVYPGTIHAIIGENGAGKSTAMKILYGVYPPDQGEIFLNGVQQVWQSPLNAIKAGVGMVHQHFMLASPFSALDNIILGAEPPFRLLKKFPQFLSPISRGQALLKLKKLSEQYGLTVPWTSPVGELPLGMQQRIEILKLLYRDAKLLILDEPTAVLIPQEIEELFHNLKKLRTEGKTIIMITHKLREVMDVTDQVTVLRGGKVVGERRTHVATPQELANLMTGRTVELTVSAPPQPQVGLKVLRVKNLFLTQKGEKNRLHNINFSVQAGEIVGIAGVDGNGQSELMRALLHPRDPRFRSKGEVWILGKNVTQDSTCSIKALGVGVVPEDRQFEGLLLDSTLSDNFQLGFQRRKIYQRLGFIRFKNLIHRTSQMLQHYDVRPQEIETLAENLSGGNQQKLIVGREFQQEPKLLFASQPTRGVDVVSTTFIHRQIFQARDQGAGVLLVSSEIDEVLTLSDRIFVFYEGEIVAEFKKGEVDENELGFHMGGAGKVRIQGDLHE
jgi:general nucleoside transport system ATP-binding protein